MIFHHVPQDLIARAKGPAHAIFDHQQQIAFLNGRWPVRHDQHRTARLFGRPDRRVQRQSAVVIKVRVRLIQHQQHGVAKQRPRKADTLDLPARKTPAQSCHTGIIAFGQFDDHIMRCGLLGGLHDLGRIGIRLQSRDIFGNCAFKQCHPLRQITDIAAQDIGVILIQRCAIQAHFAARRFPNANQRAGKGGFTRA